MIPIRDLNPTRTKPYVNYALIAANVLVWLWEYALIQAGACWVIPGYGMVPARLVADPAGEAFTILTSMFMHGGWSHIAFNMLFLYIFGDNVEDAVGHYRYLLFYLAGGLSPRPAQLAIGPASHIPMIGASGAIAALLGAYVVLYPRAPVTVQPVLSAFVRAFLEFPAWVVVGEFFVWNLVGGLGRSARRLRGCVVLRAHRRFHRRAAHDPLVDGRTPPRAIRPAGRAGGHRPGCRRYRPRLVARSSPSRDSGAIRGFRPTAGMSLAGCRVRG